MLSKIMKRAHELAQQMEGHYAARLSLALREAWKEAKEVFKFEKEGVEFSVSIEGVQAFLEANGEKARVVSIERHHERGWYYEVNRKFVETVLNKKFPSSHNWVKLLDPSAEKVRELIRQAKEKAKEEERKQAEAAFQQLNDDAKVTLIVGTSHSFAYVDEEEIASKASFFNEAVRAIKGSDIKVQDILGRGADDADWGDYSHSFTYYVTLSELKQLVEEAEKVLNKKEEEAAKKQAALEAERQEKFKEARRTGKGVELRRWVDSCDDPHEECDIDHVVEYALPNGETKIERYHTW